MLWGVVEWSGVECWHGGYAGYAMGAISWGSKGTQGQEVLSISTRRGAFKHKFRSSPGNLTLNLIVNLFQKELAKFQRQN